VLCVCTAEYERRVEGLANVGEGVFWEGRMICNYLYNEKGNRRFIPVLIDGAHEDVIPRIFRGWNRYRLTTFRLNGSDPGYEGLYRLLTRQPATLMTEVGTLQKLPPRAIKPELGQRRSEPPRERKLEGTANQTTLLHHEQPITEGSNLQKYAPIMKDFFISYTKADKAWAEWIAWTLEEVGLSVIIQAWDFRPGGNFVLDMQRSASGAEKTIVLLSPAYLQSEYTQPEWAAAFAQDPKGTARKLIPVRIAK
jgi:hypothetical protein